MKTINNKQETGTNRAWIAAMSALLLCLPFARAAEESAGFPWRVPQAVTELWAYRGPAGVAVAPDGRILVADEFNDQVQVFSPDGKRAKAFGGPGTGHGQFDRPTGLAVDAKGAIYVVDQGNDRIQKFDAAGAFVAAWGGSGEGDGQFRGPTAVALDKAGNLYVTDTLNRRVQALGPDGTFKAKWGAPGDGPGQFGWPSGIAVDGGGDVWVSDSANNRILGFDSAGKPKTTIDGAAAGLNWPAGLAVDTGGRLYAADSQHRRVKVFTREGKLERTLGGDGVADVRLAFPHSLAVAPDGKTLYCTDWTGNRLQALDAAGADKGSWKVTAEGRFNMPDKITVDARGNILVGDAELFNIQVLDSNGHEQPGGIPWLSGSGGWRSYTMVVDAAGNMYVASPYFAFLSVYDAQGRCLLLPNFPGQRYTYPTRTIFGVALDSQGAMIVLGRDLWNKKDPEGLAPLQRYKADGTPLGEVKLTGATLERMDGIAMDRKDNLYIQEGNRVVKFDSAGKYLGDIQGPGWIAWTPAGEFFYGLTTNYDIEKYAADGRLLKKWAGPRQLPGRGSNLGRSPDGGIAAGPDGKVYVTDPSGHRVLVFSPDGELVMRIGRYADYPKNHGAHYSFFSPMPASTSEAMMDMKDGPLNHRYYQVENPVDQQYRDRSASDLDLLARLEKALLAEPAAEKTGAAYERLAWNCLNVAGSPDTCGDIQRGVAAVEGSLKRVLAALPPGSPLAARLRQAQRSSLEQALRCLAGRRVGLGRCAVSLGGKTLSAATHAIVIPDQPTPSEERAGRELRNWLEQVTGQDLPLVKDAEADPAKRSLLVVGRSTLLPKLGVTVDWKKLGTDGIALQGAGAHLSLAGGQRGALYAVYTFLEDQLGCRWYTPDCTVVPKAGERRIEKLAVTFVPPFEYRDQLAFIANDPDWAVRNKYLARNFGHVIYNSARGGGFACYPSPNHTFYDLVRPDKHFKDHPEYFSMIDGKRQAGRDFQLCLSNKAVEDLVVQDLLDGLQKYPWMKVVSVSQNDWNGYCQCPQCKAVDDEEGSPSGSIIRFVNRVAERLEKTHPDLLVHTFAYQYSRKPPLRVKPRPNVVVQLCSVECNQARPLSDKEDKLNAPFASDLEAWAKVCDRLWIWDYANDFMHEWPQPNLWTRKLNMEWFRANHVRGVLQQQAYIATHEMQEERTWLMAKLMWNPAEDDKALFADFLKAYYGPAAGPIGQYIQKSHDYVRERNIVLGIGWHRDDVIPLDVLKEWEQLFSQAASAAASDVTILHRVEKARLPVLYARIRLETDPAVKAELLDWYARVAWREGMTQTGEKWDGPSLDGWLFKQRLTLTQGKK